VMMEDADKSSGVLYTAENFHYDPMNRIARELIRNGAIGEPRLMMHNSVGGGNRIIVTAWRHYKRGGGPLLDVGVHSTYVTEYLMGEIEGVYAQARLHEKIRQNSDGTQQIEADAEDATYATFLFHSGAVCQYIEDHAGRGQGIRQRLVYGSKGSLELPGDRTGNPIIMNLDGKGRISGEGILEYIPDFHLDEITTALFGSEKLWHYEQPFPETDRKLLAIEYADFAEAILSGRPTEVKPQNAMRAVAVVYAMLESQRLQRAVTVEEVMNEEVSAYQDEINKEIGLIN